MWPLLSSFSLFLATKLALSDDDRKIFIPLSLTRAVPQPPYQKSDNSDPDIQAFWDFHDDLDLQTEVKSMQSPLPPLWTAGPIANEILQTDLPM